MPHVSYKKDNNDRLYKNLSAQSHFSANSWCPEILK